MGFKRGIAILWLLFPAVFLWAQQSQSSGAGAANVSDLKAADPDKRTERPLSAEQERERSIRLYDPLNREDPSARGGQSGITNGGTSSGVQPTEQRLAPAPRALPGSVAASMQPTVVNPRSQGPEVLDASPGESPVQQYTGPAVLSRSYTLSRPAIPQAVKWSTSFGFSTLYDTGLTAGQVNPGGTVDQVSSFGTQASWGIAGRHFWKRDQVGLDYSGNMNRYSGASSYNGTNHNLSFDYGHTVSRHLTFNLVETATSTTQSFALQSQALTGAASIANISLAASPTIGILDQGTKQFSSMADVTWQRSARTSFNFGGGVFFVERTGVGFSGMTGYQARSDANYRYTQKMTIGTYYSYTDYVFAKNVSVSGSHTVGGIFSYAFDRRTQFRLRAGMTSVESTTLTAVAFDPAIALLLGQPGGIISVYRKSYLQDVSAQFVRDLGRRRSASLAYAKGLSPGTGTMLASSRQSFSGSFSMTLFRENALSFSAGADKLSSLDAMTTLTQLSAPSVASANYSSHYVRASVSHPHPHGITSSYTMDYRFQGSGPGLPSFDQLRLTVGFGFSPGEGRLW